MDFGLSEDQTIFQQSLRRWLAEKAPLERVRTIMESPTGFDRTLLCELAEQGVTGVLVPAEHGGSGLGLLDAAVAAEELGAAATPLGFHGACVMAPLAIAAGGSEATKSRWLPAIADGSALVSFAADGVEVDGDRLRGAARFVGDAEAADAFVVRARTNGGEALFVVDREAAGLAIERLDQVDQSRRVAELVFDDVAVESEARLRVEPGDIEWILDAGRIALAADALGAAERGLERAVAYSLERKQFGRVIGSFQAVKHMCAETAAEIEPLRALVWYAAFAWDERREDAHAVAAAVKAHAAEVGVRATTTCVQVFGGMGFTWECDMHLWFKRAGFDRQVLGGPVELRARAVEELLALL